MSGKGEKYESVTAMWKHEKSESKAEKKREYGSAEVNQDGQFGTLNPYGVGGRKMPGSK